MRFRRVPASVDETFSVPHSAIPPAGLTPGTPELRTGEVLRQVVLVCRLCRLVGLARDIPAHRQTLSAGTRGQVRTRGRGSLQPGVAICFPGGPESSTDQSRQLGARACAQVVKGELSRSLPTCFVPSYPIADVMALQYAEESPANPCGPWTISCSLRKFPWESTVSTIERYPESLSRTELCEV